MRHVGAWAWAACLLLAGGCGSSGLRTLAATEAQYLVELQRAMPAVVDAHDLALQGVIARAQEAEDQVRADEQAEAIAGVVDDAVRGASLNLQAPSRDAVHEALERLMKYHGDQLALTEAARAARQGKAKAVGEALARLGATLPTLVTHQQMIANYLEAQGGLPPIGGVSLAERPQNVEEIIERLKAIGRNLDVQFARSREIYEAAKKAAAGGAKP